MSIEEYPSNEEVLLKSDLLEIQQANKDRLETDIADDLTFVTIALYGILTAPNGRSFGAAIVEYSDSELQITTISLANKIYIVSSEGVIDQKDSSYLVGEGEIMKLRLKLRETEWGVGRYSLPFRVDT